MEMNQTAAVDLTFAIMVDAPLKKVQFADELCCRLAHAECAGGYIKCAGNVIESEQNPQHDENKAKAQSDKSWMFCRYSFGAHSK